MKKKGIIILSCFLVGLFLLIFINIGFNDIYQDKGNDKKANNEVEKRSDEVEKKSNEFEKGSESGLNNNLKKSEIINSKINEDVKTLRKDSIDIEKFELDYVLSSKGEIGEYYKSFQKDFESNYLNQKKRDFEKGKERVIKVKVLDLYNKPVALADIYLWGYLIGKTDNKGDFRKTIKIPDNLDYLNFTAKKKGYSWGFKPKNELYSTSSLISLKFKLKQIKNNIFNVVDLNKFDLNGKNLSISSNGKQQCLFKSKDGSCYNGGGEIIANWIRGGNVQDVENLSIPMQSIHNGKIKYLASNGMAFLNFYDKDGNKLKFNSEKKLKICYNIPQADLDSWNSRRQPLDNVEGYWWFDKSVSYWKFGKMTNPNLNGNKWCFKTSYIY